MANTLTARSHGILRYSSSDAVLIALSLVYAGLLLSMPSIPLIALGLWWTANTVAHNFIHTPFFRARSLNRVYSLYLSALMGFPQELWRERHLRHHRGDDRRVQVTPNAIVETIVVLSFWLLLALTLPRFFASVYFPASLAALSLCFLQGHFEHAGGTTSHYGWLYNRLFFNDGYHVEHHRHPGAHWTRLPFSADPHPHRSRWPPVLRWLDGISLEALERVALRSTVLQRYLIASHERAFRRLLPRVPQAHRITIVGGGLFPRTALILRRLLPGATLSIVDA